MFSAIVVTVFLGFQVHGKWRLWKGRGTQEQIRELSPPRTATARLARAAPQVIHARSEFACTIW